ncbi:hypothetical protein NKR19_g1458 [Coniochaeta hoffmannii]|uniref:Uncharacterized protein n=1 Tax=Coniochaeta hoffmannii TaxID=91930 RepID=A0AA38W3B8_9PEZI|nr:hypothetical protein NKR19_g1458 [Coniochaeta hoffmannii]
MASHVFSRPQFERTDLLQLLVRVNEAYRLYLDAPPASVLLEWPGKFPPPGPANSQATYAHWMCDPYTQRINAAPSCPDYDSIPEGSRSLTIGMALALCSRRPFFIATVLDFWAALVGHARLGGEGDAPRLWATRFKCVVLQYLYRVSLPTSDASPSPLAAGFDPAEHAVPFMVHTYSIEDTQLQGVEEGGLGLRCEACEEEERKDWCRCFGRDGGVDRDDFETCFRRMFLKWCLKVPDELVERSGLVNKIDGVNGREKRVVLSGFFRDVKKVFDRDEEWRAFFREQYEAGEAQRLEE